MTKFLAIDYGLLRTGLSISDSDKIFAFPLQTMETNKLINHLTTLIENENISRIIIGQPKRFSGQDSEIESSILKFIDSISNIYRRPVAYVNALPIGDFNSSNPKTIWMPKTIVNSKNKPLSLQELIEKKLISFHTNAKLQKYNLRVIDNSSEEICEVVSELEEKIVGSWNASKNITKKRKWVEGLLLSSWKEFPLYHHETAFQKKSFGHFSELFFKKIF